MELFQIALALTKASTVAIIISCMPMAIIPFACLFLKERFTQGTALALVFCVLGICFIINPFEIDPELGGILAAIGAMITFAIYSVMGKAAVATYGSIPFMCFSFLAGALILLGLAVAADVLGPQLGNPVLARLAGVSLIDGINPANALCLLYFAVFGTGLGFLFYFLAMEETSASTGSIVFFIKPALAPLLACLLLGERIAPNVLLGIALVIVGTWFAFRGARRRVAA
jgi:drug/metabolite transporter (DMT)-like permease